MGILSLQSRATFVLAAALTHLAWGQVATDGTVGPRMALTGPNFDVPANLGLTVGNNLFHSFQHFNLAVDNSATFGGPSTIANVITRVTGGAPSSLDGTLNCTIPNADFYFVNPAGVVLGPNARVNVSGAFALSTADYVRLGEAGRFDARQPVNDVLTVAPPSAFGFLPPEGGKPGSVQFNGSKLDFAPQQTVTVAAGDIAVSNGAQLSAPGGTFQLSAVASTGELPIVKQDTGAFETLADIKLAGRSRILVSGDAAAGKGNFVIHAHDLAVSEQSEIGGIMTGTDALGDSVIDLRETLSVDQGSVVVGVTGQATGSVLSIIANDLEVLNQGIIGSVTLGTGNASQISIAVREQIEVGNASTIISTTDDHGDAGNISITAPTILVHGRVSSGSLIFSNSDGAAGAITIEAKDLLLEGGLLSSETHGAGRAGNITIRAENTILMDDGGIFSGPEQFSSGALGKGGDISITTATLEMANRSRISSETDGTGDGGNIAIGA